ncbi:transposase [Sphingobacterium sp. LRF_L2]|uniref:transposase n=1 Tax=Sphingobacterium sp. LRF_L2 TaxID=3369421 RepID=UPI003F5D6F05
MTKLFLAATAFGLLTNVGCQNIKDEKNDPKVISAKAIEIHDEIMPQISTFDRHTVLIDSLLQNLPAQQTVSKIDTAETRQDLLALKGDLESATDKMMTWMKDYVPDSTDASYQKAEVERISNLKVEFDQVTKDAERVLTPFK